VPTPITQAEAAARSELLEVSSYRVHLDLMADPGSVRSRTEIVFNCRRPGATTFADLDAAFVHAALLNGEVVEPGPGQAHGRLQLPGEALPAIRRLESQAAQPLAGALFPVTLADEATLAATDAELGQMQPTDPTHAVLLDHRAIVQEVIAARTIAAAARLSRSGSPCSDRAGGPD